MAPEGRSAFACWAASKGCLRTAGDGSAIARQAQRGGVVDVGDQEALGSFAQPANRLAAARTGAVVEGEVVFERRDRQRAVGRHVLANRSRHNEPEEQAVHRLADLFGGAGVGGGVSPPRPGNPIFGPSR